MTTFEEPQQDQGDGGFDPNCFFYAAFGYERFEHSRLGGNWSRGM